jgi:hypothetical protein
VATTDLKGAQTRISTTGSDAESADEAQARIARVEQRMLDAEAIRTAADTPARETKSVLYLSYEAALAAGREIGASRADDNALMALFCEGPLQTLVGAVSPELVWDGAQRQGLTTRELGKLANSDVMAVSDLQWVDDTPTAPLPRLAVDAMRSLELALTTPDPGIVEKVRTRLGFPTGWKPNAHLGETATYLTAWSQMELNALFERVGGTITSRQVKRNTSDGSSTWAATEITLTVQVSGVGPVEIVTDIEDDPEHGYRTDLPVVAVARYEAASLHCQTLAASADFDGCLVAQDEMRMCRCQLEQAGRLDLIGGA